jgi:hypothetical protein
VKVLALQDSSYFNELGIDFSGCSVTFGLTITLSVKRVLQQYDLIVSCLDHDLSAIRVVKLANFLNIPTLYIADGVYDITNAIKNPVMIELNKKQLFPAIYGTIFCVGAKFVPWYGEFYPKVNIYTYIPKRASLPKIDTAENRRKGILFTTALRPYFDQKDFESLVDESLRFLRFLSDNNYDIKLRISDDRFLSALSEYKHLNSTEGNISEAMLNSECVVSTTSTILFTCYEYGIPHVLLNYRNDEILYDVEVSLSRGESLCAAKLDEMITSQSYKEWPKSGCKLKDYNYPVVPFLECDTANFKNFGFNFFIRRVYRGFSPSLRKKIKRVWHN